MSEIIYDLETGEPLRVELRDPYWAVLLAWLWPGAGHFYQRRFAKGFLFMICVLSTFFVGLGIGRGRVVYASLDRADFRWQYICQAGVGLPASPAILQAIKTSGGGDPLFVMAERFPEGTTAQRRDSRFRDFERIPADFEVPADMRTLKDGFMAPPAGRVLLEDNDVLGTWHTELKHWFEIGTVYTVVAGLLNFLAMYDAFAGPVIVTPAERRKMDERRRAKDRNRSG